MLAGILLARRGLPLWSVPWQLFNPTKCTLQTSQHALEVSPPVLWSLFARHLTLHCSLLLHGSAQEPRVPPRINWKQKKM